jgi:hypothetical protein
MNKKLFRSLKQKLSLLPEKCAWAVVTHRRNADSAPMRVLSTNGEFLHLEAPYGMIETVKYKNAMITTVNGVVSL